MYSYRITPSARQDLAEIKQYISEELFAPQSAKDLMLAFKRAFEGACQFPQSIPPVTEPKLHGKGYRKIIVKNYIAFVLLDHEQESLDIMRVVYYSRDYQKCYEHIILFQQDRRAGFPPARRLSVWIQSFSGG